MKENQIMVVIKEPGKAAYVDPLFDNTLEAFQNAVGGYIEVVSVGRGMNGVLICNEEGKLLDLPLNVSLGWDDLVGTVIAVGVRGEEFASLKAAEIPCFMNLLGRE